MSTVVEDGARSYHVHVANHKFSSKIFKLGAISDLVCAFYAHLDAARQLESNRSKRPIDHVARSSRKVQVDLHVQPDVPSRICLWKGDPMAPFNPFHTTLRSARKSLRRNPNNILNEWDDGGVNGDDVRGQSSVKA
ncbi:hypothetical protein EDB84DRAFT_1569835 [Lactarius hengduanensis]|nr:hypothetical protein EDB84DRAFT_1569835 [Lactarius hengduanensis]